MKHLIVLAVAVAFALTVSVPGVWAQGAATPPAKVAPPAKTAAPAPAPAAPAQKKEAEKKDSEKLDLNTASAADLKGAGFSDAEVKKIVDGRPYKRKDELVKKNIITKEKYEQVKENIIAHQVKSEAKKK